jgi:chemotaxis protein methyltransferase CheR
MLLLRGTPKRNRPPPGGRAPLSPLRHQVVRPAQWRAERNVYDRLREIARQQAGIDLRPEKNALVAARVAKRLRALGLGSPAEYLALLESDTSGQELVDFLNVISTNVTSFFREDEHFTLLAETVRGWLELGQRRLRVWSAAASSGEEPYSIAMTLADQVGERSVDYKVLATDLSTAMLERARAGCYASRATRAVPPLLRSRFLEAVPGAPDRRRIRDELRDHVSFHRMNLSAPPFPLRGPLDCVFCRNVIMYFGPSVRQRLIQEVERLLRPAGLFIIGRSETLLGLDTKLRMLRPSVFVKDCPEGDGHAR